jgi:hypothetical protein
LSLKEEEVMRITNAPFASLASMMSQSTHGGRMSIAVAPQAYIYSHFRHVSGIPAGEGQTGAPVTSLRMLDNMIEQRQSRLHESQGALLNFTA